MSTLERIGRIHTDLPTKFGAPRQSGIVEALKGKIIFEPKYRNPHALRGLEDFSHIWLLWEFSENIRQEWKPMVKPPRLGGQKRMGVFATRSPFRPNPIGLSCVKLEKIVMDPKFGPVLYVTGVDLIDNTPIYDIKPYLAYTDAHEEATGGFSDEVRDYKLEVEFPEELLELLPKSKQEAILSILAQDPRPSYQNDPTRRYGVEYAGFDVRFKVEGSILKVCEIVVL